MCALIFVSLYISKNLIDEHLLPKDIRHMGSLRALERSKASLSPPHGICCSRQGCPVSLCFRSPQAFSLLAAALMRAAPPIVNCVLTGRRVSLQSTKLQESVQDEQSWALSIVPLLPAAAWLVRNTRNCQLFPDNASPASF